MSVDPRGFKTLVQLEAQSFLGHDQLRLNSTVTMISYSANGVLVTLEDGQTLTADYAICTFRQVSGFSYASKIADVQVSLGVLQHQDIRFVPPLPWWKQEAIHSMTMVS